jgi:hypothetical protein
MPSADPNDKQASWGSFWYFSLLQGHDGNDIQQDLRFLHEQFDDRQPFGPLNQHCDEEALRLALGPPVEVASSGFWHSMLYFGGFQTYDMSIPRPFTDLLTRYDSEHMYGYTQLQLLARFLGRTLADSIRADARIPTNLRVDIEELIVAAISMGLDIHEGSPYMTPFQIMLISFVTGWLHGDRPLNEGLKKALLTWLRLIQRAGIDLSEYGKAEGGFGREQWPIRPWVYFHDDVTCIHFFALKPSRFQFTYGPTPADWGVTLLDFVEECSGDFWRLVEAQAEEALFEKCVLPGGWVSV